MLLLIDNFDSFTHNLARYFEELGQQVKVVRNNAITVAEIAQCQPDFIVLSPGPCTPKESGICLDVIQHFSGQIPILGVCLGHQAIAYVHGADIIKAPYPIHGKVSTITHNGQGLFCDLPKQFAVTRYHSLVIDPHTLSDDFTIDAQIATLNRQTNVIVNESIVMAISAPHLGLYGVQFHPESLLTEYGHELLANFLQTTLPN